MSSNIGRVLINTQQGLHTKKLRFKSAVLVQLKCKDEIAPLGRIIVPYGVHISGIDDRVQICTPLSA